MDGTTRPKSGIRACVLLIGACIAFSTIGAAQQLPINHATRVQLQSEILKESREIWVSTPAEYGLSEKSYPVLFLMDARWHFNHVAGTAEFLHNVQQAPPMIIVGIVSYNRSKDMLPPELNAEADKFGPHVGGADDFLEFIDEEVGAYLKEHYRVSDYRMLFGHSLGGVTVMHAFKARPQSFDSYHAFSPSLRYLEDGYLKDWVESVAGSPESPRSLFISVGSEEQALFRDVERAMIRPLNAKLTRDSNLHINVVPGDHSSMVHGAISESLLRYFSDWTLEAAAQAYQSGGYPGLRAHLTGIRERYPFDTSQVLNRKMFGVAEYMFLSQGVGPAMDLLMQYVSDYPQLVSPLIYEALGQGYYIRGERERAVEVMEEVYSRNPGSELAVDILAQASGRTGVALPPEPLATAELKEFVGTYALAGEPVLEIFIRDDQLWGRSRVPGPDRLRWLGDNTFYAVGSDRIRYQFSRDDDSSVVGLKRESAWGSVAAKKLSDASL